MALIRLQLVAALRLAGIPRFRLARLSCQLVARDFCPPRCRPRAHAVDAATLLPAAGRALQLSWGQEPAMRGGHLSGAPAVSGCSDTGMIHLRRRYYSCQCAGVRQRHLHLPNTYTYTRTVLTRRARRGLLASFHHEHALFNYVVVPGPLGVCQHHRWHG